MHMQNDTVEGGPLLISLRGACKFLGVARSRAPREDGWPPAIRVGDRYYVERAAFENYCANKLGRPIKISVHGYGGRLTAAA
jgi:hypothetical protein